MKVTFIVPAIGKKPGQRYIGTWKMEPLTIALLAALTPPEVERELFDDRIELIELVPDGAGGWLERPAKIALEDN